MATFIEDAKSLYAEALKLFEEARRTSSKTILTEACRKCWLACVRAVDGLLQSRNISLPKGDKERRACLELLESIDPRAKAKEIADRQSVRYHHLYEEGVLGYMDPVRARNEFERAKRLIEDIERLTLQ
ncbi:MAG: hypothetical protein AB1485_05135 [Candidatus Thermoplasmatota archaeon]